MTTLLAIASVVVASGIDVTLAPDQPIPHIYVGDPLILELESDTDVSVTVRLDVESDAGDAVTIDLGTIPLRAKGTHWKAVERTPKRRGRYTARITLNTPSGQEEQTHTFCRIDRPAPSLTLPIAVDGLSCTPHELDALAAVSLRRVRVDASLPDVDERIAAIAAAGMGAIVVFDPAKVVDAPTLAERLAQAHGARIIRWDVEFSHDLPGLVALAPALRTNGSDSSVAFVVRSPAQVRALLGGDARRFASGLVIHRDARTGPDLGAFRRAAESLGRERIPLYVVGQGRPTNESQAGARFLQQLVRARAARVVEADVHSSLVYDDGTFGQGYVLLGGLARVLHGSTYVGRLPLASSVEAHVFRNAKGWHVVAWTADSERAKATLDIGDVTDLSAASARNNPLDPPSVSGKGQVDLNLTGMPYHLSGTGGRVLLAAARCEARREAGEFLETEAFRKELPDQLFEIVRKVADPETPRLERPDFFVLLRTFPFLESEWHTGGVSRATAISAMANLARLVRCLCVVEQEAGEPFFEPLQDTLARCSQYESLYLTRSSGGPAARERGDWLLAEVGRLMAEAGQLVRDGREIEANALAAMAEWRARSLEYAALPPPPQADIEPPAPPVPAESDDQQSAADRRRAEEESPAEVSADRPREPAEEDRHEEEEDAAPEPTSDAPEPVPAGTTTIKTYKVKAGENPWSIANKHGVLLPDLLEWNRWQQNQVLYVQQEYVVHEAGGPAPSPDAGSDAPQAPEVPAGTVKETHRVEEGEGPWAISQKHGVTLEELRRWNNWKKNRVLGIGDEYVLYRQKERAGDDAERRR